MDSLPREKLKQTWRELRKSKNLKMFQQSRIRLQKLKNSQPSEFEEIMRAFVEINAADLEIFNELKARNLLAKLSTVIK